MKKIPIVIGIVVGLVLISGCAEKPSPIQTPGPSGTTSPSEPSGTTSPSEPSGTTSPSGPSGTTSVEIRGFSFNPDTIDISKGTTVTWTNNDNVQHTVTGKEFAGKEFDSGIIPQGKTFSYTFNNIGTFEYICSVHPASMKGKVIVT